MRSVLKLSNILNTLNVFLKYNKISTGTKVNLHVNCLIHVLNCFVLLNLHLFFASINQFKASYIVGAILFFQGKKQQCVCIHTVVWWYVSMFLSRVHTLHIELCFGHMSLTQQTNKHALPNDMRTFLL